MENLLKKASAVIVVLFLVLASFGPALAGETKYVTDLNNAKCPVLGGDAQKDVYTISKGKVYHFCCASCIPKFKKEPARYMKSVKSAPADEQTKYEIDGNEKCPIMGNPVDKNISAVKDEKVYYFCCPGCIEKFLDGETGAQSVIPPQNSNLNKVNGQLRESSQTDNGGHSSHSSGGGCH